MRSWMLYVVVPFTPLVLEFLKFYAPDRPAAAFQVLGRLATALLFTVGVVVLLVLSVAASEGSAPFLMNGGFFALILLFARDQLSVAVKERAQRKNRPQIP